MKNSNANYIRGIAGSSMLVLAAMLAVPAYAQESSEAADSAPSSNSAGSSTVSSDGANRSGDIIVTANKREQSINRVGLAITALSGDALVLQLRMS